MNDASIDALTRWVTEAGLIGRSESELMAGFCRRVREAGVPLARAMVILDTLHPVYEGRAFAGGPEAPRLHTSHRGLFWHSQVGSPERLRQRSIGRSGAGPTAIAASDHQTARELRAK